MNGWILFNGEPVPEITRAAEEAQNAGIDLQIIDPQQVDLVLDPENTTTVFVDGQPTKVPLFVIPAFLEDQSYYSLAVLRQLESIGVFCLNSTETMLNTNDKMRTMQLLTAAKIPVPKTMLLKYPANPKLVQEQFGFPVVMKVMTGAKGSGVVLIKSEKELDNMLQMYDAAGFEEQVIFQEFIADSSGKDIRVLIIGGEPKVGMLRTSASKDEFRSNFSAGGGVAAFPLDEKITQLAKEVTACLGLNLGGIDLLMKGDGYVVCEANSMPGFQGIEKCTDLNVPAEILKSIAGQLQKKIELS